MWAATGKVPQVTVNNHTQKKRADAKDTKVNMLLYAHALFLPALY